MPVRVSTSGLGQSLSTAVSSPVEAANRVAEKVLSEGDYRPAVRPVVRRAVFAATAHRARLADGAPNFASPRTSFEAINRFLTQGRVQHVLRGDNWGDPKKMAKTIGELVAARVGIANSNLSRSRLNKIAERARARALSLFGQTAEARPPKNNPLPVSADEALKEVFTALDISRSENKAEPETASAASAGRTVAKVLGTGALLGGTYLLVKQAGLL